MKEAVAADVPNLEESARKKLRNTKKPSRGSPSTWTPNKHERTQWEKLRLLPNMLYTDGCQWALYRDGEPVGTVAHLNGDIRQVGDKPTPADGELEAVRPELGYREKGNQYTKFGEWQAANVGWDPQFTMAPWCDMFIAWAANKAGVQNFVGEYAYTPAHAVWFQKDVLTRQRVRRRPGSGGGDGADRRLIGGLPAASILLTIVFLVW